jgi:hypothetical protein
MLTTTVINAKAAHEALQRNLGRTFRFRFAAEVHSGLAQRVRSLRRSAPHRLTRPARLSPPRGAGWEPVCTLRSTRRAKKSHLVGAVGAGAVWP